MPYSRYSYKLSGEPSAVFPVVLSTYWYCLGRKDSAIYGFFWCVLNKKVLKTLFYGLCEGCCRDSDHSVLDETTLCKCLVGETGLCMYKVVQI